MTLTEAEPGHLPAAAREPRCDPQRNYEFFSVFSPYEQTEQIPRLTPERREAEMARVHRAIAGEKEWLGEVSYQPYHSAADLKAAIDRGELVPLREGDDVPYRAFQQNTLQPGGLENVTDETATIAYTRPETLEALEELGAKFDELCTQNQALQDWMASKSIRRLRISVSSVTRSATYQQELQKRGSLAAEPGESIHNYGLGIDMSNFGYYAEVDGVSGDRFTKAIPVNIQHNPEYFSPEVIDALQAALDNLDDRGVLRYINEVPFACGSFHMAVRPRPAISAA